MSAEPERPFRVLSLDGGGMRGTYATAYLSCLADAFARKRELKSLDIGAAFDLIVGTSTGGIIAFALAAGVPVDHVNRLYREHGPAIFPLPLRPTLGSLLRQFGRGKALARGTTALRSALQVEFGDLTIGELYRKRKIALAITAVEMTQHRSWVFKTRHLSNSNGRDDAYRVVDVCLATTAAPLYRSLEAIDHPSGTPGYYVFADGGLWANNPVLVGLTDALRMAAAGRSIEIYCLGTCPLSAGERIAKSDVHRGLRAWMFGGHAASLSIDAQEFAYDNMARMLSHYVDRPCEVLRFPRQHVPASLMPFLALDDTSPEAAQGLMDQARTDTYLAYSRCENESDREGRMLKRLFMEMPPSGQ